LADHGVRTAFVTVGSAVSAVGLWVIRFCLRAASIADDSVAMQRRIAVGLLHLLDELAHVVVPELLEGDVP
jgi:hypothetical protein